MRFTSAVALTASTAAVAALFMATPAAAIDERVQVTYPSQSPTDFCNKWRCSCVNYVPTNKALYFEGTLCEPGDYHGKNPETTSKVFCVFTDGNSLTPVNKHIAAATGATLA